MPGGNFDDIIRMAMGLMTTQQPDPNIPTPTPRPPQPGDTPPETPMPETIEEMMKDPYWREKLQHMQGQTSILPEDQSSLVPDIQ